MEKKVQLPQDIPSAEHPLAQGQEPRVAGGIGEDVSPTSVETRHNPDGVLGDEEDEELNISGAHGGPKLPRE